MCFILACLFYYSSFHRLSVLLNFSVSSVFSVDHTTNESVYQNLSVRKKLTNTYSIILSPLSEL